MIIDDIPRGDLQALARLNRWGGEKLIQQMAALFRTEVPTRLLAIRGAVKAGDCVAAEKAAHSLKSSCAQLGAARMRVLAEGVEVLAAAGTLDTVSATVDVMEQEFAGFTDWLDETANAAPEVER